MVPTKTTPEEVIEVKIYLRREGDGLQLVGQRLRNPDGTTVVEWFVSEADLLDGELLMEDTRSGAG